MKASKAKFIDSWCPGGDPLTGLPIHLAFGKVRRGAIMKMFASNPNKVMAVNRKWCPQLKKDRDLQHLIKKGKLKVVRDSAGGSCRHTQLVLPDCSGQFCKWPPMWADRN